MPLFQRKHYEFLVEEIIEYVSWPDKIHAIAKKLEKDNPDFNANIFISKANVAWEKANLKEPELDDEIPHLRVS